MSDKCVFMKVDGETVVNMNEVKYIKTTYSADNCEMELFLRSYHIHDWPSRMKVVTTKATCDNFMNFSRRTGSESGTYRSI